MSLLERNGIPGPKPRLISGNISDFRNMRPIDGQRKLIDQFGKIVGYYNGYKPQVLVADPELAKLIQIKDFQYFADRPHSTNKYIIPGVKSMLTRLAGRRWKDIRSALTPTFSGFKLRTMTPIVDSAINEFIDQVDTKAQTDSEFDIYNMFQKLTTDVIGRTAFGIQCNVQNQTNNRFLKAAKEVFNIKSNYWINYCVRCYPPLYDLIFPFRRLRGIVDHWRGLSPNGVLFDMASDVIQLRKSEQGNRRKDLLQLMLDTKISSHEVAAISYDSMANGIDSNNNLINDNHMKRNGYKNGVKDNDNNNKSVITLTEDEIQANCVLFYEAGYETTSTALGFIAHILITHPEVQDKCRQEVQQLFERDGRLDFNTVCELNFMDCVINETLRMYPPVITFVSRECLKDYSYQGMTIPKGACVHMATHYMQRDPDYWPQPEVFDPDRFSPDRRQDIHPSSWQPFGDGPRNCIGMRFAMFEIKLALAKLLIKYRLIPGPHTEMDELTTQCKLLSLTPKRGVFVKVIQI